MNPNIQRAIFVTNAFADACPQEHHRLWNIFEQEVSYEKRSGYYGADNLAYINWLNMNRPVAYMNFINGHIESRSLK